MAKTGSILVAVLAIAAGALPAAASAGQSYDNTSFGNPYAAGGPYDPYRAEHLRQQAASQGGPQAKAASHRRSAIAAAALAEERARSRKRTTVLAPPVAAAPGTTAQSISSMQLQRLASTNHTMAGDHGCLSARGTGDAVIDARCH